MSIQKLYRVLLGVSVLLGGCAHAYHEYPCGCIPYDYCPEPPLPYTAYGECPTPIASRRSMLVHESRMPADAVPGWVRGTID